MAPNYNIHGLHTVFRGGGGSLYSLSGQCCVGRLEVSLSSDYRESLVTECEETLVITVIIICHIYTDTRVFPVLHVLVEIAVC